MKENNNNDKPEKESITQENNDKNLKQENQNNNEKTSDHNKSKLFTKQKEIQKTQENIKNENHEESNMERTNAENNNNENNENTENTEDNENSIEKENSSNNENNQKTKLKPREKLRVIGTDVSFSFEDLRAAFSKWGPVESVVFDDVNLKTSATIKMDSVETASKVVSESPKIEIKNKTLSVEYAPIDSLLWVANLTTEITEERLRTLFQPFGDIDRCFILRDKSGISKGYGFVEFKSNQQAARAKIALAGHNLNNRVIRVDWCDCETVDEMHAKVLFIDRLPPDYTDAQELRKFFEPHGKVEECYIVFHAGTGISRGFAFVQFETSQQAETAQKETNNLEISPGVRIRVSYGNPSKNNKQVEKMKAYSSPSAAANMKQPSSLGRGRGMTNVIPKPIQNNNNNNSSNIIPPPTHPHAHHPSFMPPNTPPAAAAAAAASAAAAAHAAATSRGTMVPPQPHLNLPPLPYAQQAAMMPPVHPSAVMAQRQAAAAAAAAASAASASGAGGKVYHGVSPPTVQPSQASPPPTNITPPHHHFNHPQQQHAQPFNATRSRSMPFTSNLNPHQQYPSSGAVNIGHGRGSGTSSTQQTTSPSLSQYDQWQRYYQQHYYQQQQQQHESQQQKMPTQAEAQAWSAYYGTSFQQQHQHQYQHQQVGNKRSNPYSSSSYPNPKQPRMM